MSDNERENSVGSIIILVIFVAGLILVALADLFHVNVPTIMKMIVGFAALGLVVFLMHRNGVALRFMFVVALAGLWACMWPALNHWELQQAAHPFLWGESLELSAPSIWWAAWYSKLGGLLGLGALGYGLGSWLDQRWMPYR